MAGRRHAPLPRVAGAHDVADHGLVVVFALHVHDRFVLLGVEGRAEAVERLEAMPAQRAEEGRPDGLDAVDAVRECELACVEHGKQILDELAGRAIDFVADALLGLLAEVLEVGLEALELTQPLLVLLDERGQVEVERGLGRRLLLI